MDFELEEALHLALRWTHVMAAILWIGQTFLFTWLERRFGEAVALGESEERARIWMVHSGGFYVVQKQIAPERMPGTLHWFKWEAATTWLSGTAILALVYWNGHLMARPGGEGLGDAAAAGLSAALLVLGTIVYEAIWRSLLPAQRAMVRAMEQGLPHDPTLAERSRRRTKHNNYLALPLVFIMLSSHFPTVSYGHEHGAWILLALLALGFGAAWALRRR